MALEACKQLADVTRKIDGYIIRDVAFQNPLTIDTTPEGVEVQIYLHPLSDPSQKITSIWEFNLCMISDGQWTENCRGKIEVSYERTLTEVDAGKELAFHSSQHSEIFERGLKMCNKSITGEQMYEQLRVLGLDYGPTFQGLEDLRYSADGEVIGQVQTFRWSASEGTNHPQPHIVHPTTLDAMLQLMFVSLSQGTEKAVPTMVASRIRRLWISSKGLDYPSIATADVHAQASFTGLRRADAGMFALEQGTRELLLSIENLEATAVSSREGVSDQSITRKLCYDIAWKPDLDLLQSHGVSEYCEDARPDRASEVSFYEDLDLVLLTSIAETLKALIIQGGKLRQPHLQQYIGWMRREMNRFEAGDLPNVNPSHNKWIASRRDEHVFDDLRSRIECTAQGIFFLRVTQNLARILNGDLDPLTFMFEGDWVSDFYREVNRKVICYEPLNRFLDAIVHKDPKIRVLEIGAGTGATTDFILEALSQSGQGSSNVLGCARYDYTDISPAFFEAAADRYKRHGSKLRFRILDIETNPSKQGFEIGTYDLLIAASVRLFILRPIKYSLLHVQVFHATKNLELTLRNARALLKP